MECGSRMNGPSGARDPMCYLGMYGFVDGCRLMRYWVEEIPWRNEVQPWRNAGACAGPATEIRSTI